MKFDGLQVADVSPEYAPDVFAGQPVIVTGRYLRPGKGKVTLSGMLGSQPYSRDIPIEFGANGNSGSGVTSLWARRKVEDLSRRDWLAQYNRNVAPRESSEKAITDLALKYGIMTQYTSFVAVEQRVVNVGGKQRTVNVPVDMTDGVNMGESLGRDKSLGATRAVLGSLTAGGQSSNGLGGGGFGGGSAGGRAGGAKGAGTNQTPATAGAPVFTNHANGNFPSKNEESLKELNDRIEIGEVKSTVKVDKALLESKQPKLEVQVWVTEVTDDVVAALKKAGLAVDDKDKSLKLVFGTIDAKKLEALAKLKSVVFVGPIEE
jgi:Ca-activated chloride channel family protein